MPWCFGSAGSWRAIRIPQRASWAWVVQTFWPLITHSSPSRSALVAIAARSLPAPGSLKSWHQISSPRSIGPRKRCFCSSVPCWMIVGPAIGTPIPRGGGSASIAWRSWLKMIASLGVAPRPPYSFGHSGAAQPLSARIANHSC